MRPPILVFGGSGFLGSHLCDKLLAQGNRVINFDFVRSSYDHPNKTEITASVESPEQIAALIREYNIELVYHLAGLADIDDCHDKPLLAVESNILLTARILEACKNSSVQKVIFSSSAYVASNKGSIYRVTKQACEGLVEEYYNNFGLKYVILRFGTLYGPRSNQKNGIYRLIREAVTQKRITYPGTGEETREFIHVLDAATLAIKTEAPEFDCQKVLLTGNRTIQYKELIDMVNEMMGNQLEINYKQELSHNHYMRTPYFYKKDICRKLVGDYHIDLSQGLLSLIEDIDNNEGAK